MTFRVLMVCTGNICRSTMAQAVLSEAVATDGMDVDVDSAGISAEEYGNPIDPRAERVLREAGYAVPDHRARQVQPEEIGQWDLILAMTRRHLSALKRSAARVQVTIDPNAKIGDTSTTDIRMLRAFDPELTRVDTLNRAGHRGCVLPLEYHARGAWQSIPDLLDPWYGGHQDFLDTLTIIERVTPVIVAHIRGRA